MSHVRIALTLVLDMLFPRKLSVAQFDTMMADRIAEHVRDELVVRTVPCLAPLSYRVPRVREAVHAAKFYNHERAAALLGEAISGFVAEELAERRMYGMFFSPVVIPVPLHAERLAERGFNQSERIARALARHVSEVPLRCVPKALERIRHTPNQTHLPRNERLKNVAGAFSVPDSSLVQGRSVILVDDVVTTGATMQAAREALMQAGAHDVLCVAVAH